MGVRGDHQATAEIACPTRPLVVQVEPVVRAVDLEKRPGPGRLCVDRVPLEGQLVAAGEHPARGVGDDVHMGRADRREHTIGQLARRLAAALVQAGDHDVERGQHVVLEIERGVGPDLELHPVQDAEPVRGRHRRSRPLPFLARVAFVETGHDPALLLHALRAESAGDAQPDRVIGQDDPGVAPRPGGVGHHLDRVDAVGPVRVDVAIAVQVAELDELWQAAPSMTEREATIWPARLHGRLDLAPILTELGLDPGQVEEAIDALLVGEGAQLRRLPGERLAISPEPRETVLREGPAPFTGDPAEAHVVGLRAGEVDEERAVGGRRRDHEVDLAAFVEQDGGLVRSLGEDLLDAGHRDEPVGQPAWLGRRGQQVDVPDRGEPTAERARRLQAFQPGCPGDAG